MSDEENVLGQGQLEPKGEVPEEETPETAEEGGEAATPGTEGSDSAEEKEEEAPPKRGGVEKRISELTRKLREAEREAAYLRGLADAKAGREEPASQKPPELEIPPAPKLDDYETHEEWVVATARWGAKAEAIEREASVKRDLMTAEARRIEERQVEWSEKGAAKFPGFIEDVKSLPKNQMTIALFMDSDVGQDVAYYLTRHPEENEKMLRMNPLQAARYFGQIEARVISKIPPAKSTTRAPGPTSPVEGKTSVTKNPEDMSQAEYEAWERKRRAARGGG